jgi:Protein of unknown function (DUF2442)
MCTWSGTTLRLSFGLIPFAWNGTKASAEQNFIGCIQSSRRTWLCYWEAGVNTSGIELREVPARSVNVNDEALMVDLADGRTITVPLAWFPRLAHGTPPERANWRLIGGGEGIHWPDLDEDISVESLLAGRKSGETQESLRRWLGARNVG